LLIPKGARSKRWETRGSSGRYPVAGATAPGTSTSRLGRPEADGYDLTFGPPPELLANFPETLSPVPLSTGSACNQVTSRFPGWIIAKPVPIRASPGPQSALPVSPAVHSGFDATFSGAELQALASAEELRRVEPVAHQRPIGATKSEAAPNHWPICGYLKVCDFSGPF
jgi:hypothetical protein